MDKDIEKNSIKKTVIEWIQIILSAVAIAFVINRFIIVNSDIGSGSMEPTLMTDSRILGSRLSYYFSDVERGDIVIFHYGWRCPVCEEPVEGEKRDSCPFCDSVINKNVEKVYFVKRVIGVPGDQIDIAGGSVYLNGSNEPIEEPYLPEEMNRDEICHFKVPENSYFMMGDNRNGSNDSRYWENPYIEGEKIIGKVLAEYFPQIKIIR